MDQQNIHKRSLLDVLSSEMKNRNKNGIYHRLQIDFAYNSNHIEGSTLSKDQTRYIFDTHTVGFDETDQRSMRINDIIETVNHFRCFDHIINTVNEEITGDYIKKLHSMLKNGIIYNDTDAVIREYKRYANEIGGYETVAPADVPDQMNKLIDKYRGSSMRLYDIAAFHAEFERIHPFYDGNGRVGRLIMFKQCLKNGVVPFYIDEFSKLFYYKGLREWHLNNNNERLINVFLLCQDDMEQTLKCFEIDYQRNERLYKEVVE